MYVCVYIQGYTCVHTHTPKHSEVRNHCVKKRTSCLQNKMYSEIKLQGLKS